mgnify:CR=1 FL=1
MSAVAAAPALAFALLAARWGILVYAAWRDARTRTFPNGCAAALAAVCAAWCVAGLGGAGMLGLNAVLALAVAAALVLFERAWRRRRGEAGLGMGDVKFLAALMLCDPARALAAFAAGLLGLAAAGLALRRTSLPLLPFAVGAYAVLSAAAVVLLGRLP